MKLKTRLQVKGFPFVMSRYAKWDPNNVGDLITALSKNNPVAYTPADGTPRTNVITYNERGFPIARTTTWKVAGQEYTANDTFSYNCKRFLMEQDAFNRMKI